MEHWIRYPAEPTDLLLAWQAPSSVPDRARWAVGLLQRVGNDAVFRYLIDPELRALNLGRTSIELGQAGFAGYPAFPAKRAPKGGIWEHALEAFLRRLPPMSRPDIGAYLEYHRIAPPTQLSKFALLGVTEARLPSDGFSLVDPLDPALMFADVVFEVASFRHYSNLDIRVGQQLELVAEPVNPRDVGAIRVHASGELIGYVNRLQAATIGTWLRDRLLSCWLVRLNGTTSTPRAYAFLEVRPAHALRAA